MFRVNRVSEKVDGGWELDDTGTVDPSVSKLMLGGIMAPEEPVSCREGRTWLSA